MFSFFQNRTSDKYANGDQFLLPVELEGIRSSMEFFRIWYNTRKDETDRKIYIRYMTYAYLSIVNTLCFLALIDESKIGGLERISSSVAVFFVGLCPTYTLVKLTMKKFSSWITDMFDDENYFFTHPNELFRETHLKCLKSVWPHGLLRINGWALNNSSITYGITIFIYVFRNVANNETCLQDPNCRVIFMGYFHFLWNSKKHYWLANIQNVLMGASYGLINYTRDIYLTSFICYMSSRIKTLSTVMKNIDKFVLSDDSENFDYGNENVERFLKQCVREHQEIISNFQHLRENLSSILFADLIAHVPFLVGVTVIVVQGERTNSFALFLYCGATYGLGHLFLIFWLAENLAIESVRLADAIYSTKWYEMSVKNQKIVMMMIMRSQKPLVLSCGQFQAAGLQLFVKTLRMIYTLLNALVNVSD